MKKIALLLTLIMLLLPAETVRADTSLKLDLKDGSTVEMTYQKSSNNIYGTKNHGLLVGTFIYPLKYKKDQFTTSYSENINQERAIVYLHNLFLEMDVDDFNKIKIGSKTLEEVLKDLDIDWLKKTYDELKEAKFLDPAANDKAITDFYSNFKNETKQAYAWWFYNYKDNESNRCITIDGDKFKVSDKVSPSTDAGRFVYYTLSGDNTDPNHKKAVANIAQNATYSSIGNAKDPNKFEDWCKAMVYIHENKLSNIESDKFYDFNNIPSTFTDVQKGQLATILKLPASKQPSSVRVKGVKNIASYFTSLKVTGGMEAVNETMTEALEEINANEEEDYQDWTTRMNLFEVRVKYLIGACITGTEPDEAVARFYTEPLNTMIYNPKLAYIEPGTDKEFEVHNSNAYIYLVSTFMELYPISKYVPTEIEKYINNDTLSGQTKYIQGMQSLYNGIRLIDSEQAYDLWGTPFDSSTKSLQDIYTMMNNLGAFDGLQDMSVIETARPLGTFMDLDKDVLSNLYLKGIAYTSTYQPMNTNIYDPYTLAAFDEEFLEKFHYVYGFHRKALYIDTNASAAVDLHNTGRKSETRVCTLKDLLKCEKDIVLYIDDNFYNVNQVAEWMNKSFERLDNVDEETDTSPWYKKLWTKMTDYFTIDIYEITKTAEQTQYSAKLKKKVASEKNSGYIPDASEDKDNEDQRVLPSTLINDYLDGVTKTSKTLGDGSKEDKTVYDAYTPLMGYAVISAIYRDDILYNKLDTPDISKPVFISSADLAGLSNTSNFEKSSLLNYALLKNLEANIPVDYNYNVDVNSPVYMDIYGNILTESGIVVVPAACNMTLFNDNYCKDLYNVGLFAVYGDTYSIPTTYEGIEPIMEDAFEKDKDLEIWKIKSRVIDGAVADYARITTGDKEVLSSIQNQFEYNLQDSVKLYDFTRFLNICIEVLRGAPIESIDKDFEGLNTVRRVSKSGLIAAAKLEELNNSLATNSANSILSLPNLAFMDGFEYIVLFLFKLLILIVIIVMMITVYIDGVAAQLNLKTFAKCFWVVVLTICTVVTIPAVFQITYYQSNRSLLQDETAYIAMLNLEKRQSGIEIGVYDVDVPDLSTKLLIKLEDIDVPWYDLFYKVTTTSTFNELEQLYNEYAEQVPVALESDVTVMNDGIYMYVDDLFDSADINVNLDTQELYLRTNETLSASFYSPYYVILEALIARVNEYNETYNWYAYNTKIQKGGRIKTVGLISQYFRSVDFMEEEGDILDMSTIHGVNFYGELFTTMEVEKMQKSLWTNTVLSEDQVWLRTEKLMEYMHEFVAENRSLLGKISDESFLKVMALSIAMKHNQLFGVTSADAYEIYNLSNDDLMRLSIANRNQVMINSTLTYSRFVYEVGGMPAVYAAAILSMINWISSYVKPICTIIVFIAIFVSLFVFKICLRKKTTSLYGYAITTLLLCGCNLLNSLLLKISMYLPAMNLPPTVCIILQCFIQIGYLCVLGYVTMVAFRDWRDLGYDRYQSMINKVKAKMPGDNRYNDFGKRQPKQNNWQYYNNLVDIHQQRNWRY